MSSPHLRPDPPEVEEADEEEDHADGEVDHERA